jgi:hypothetical protein
MNKVLFILTVFIWSNAFCQSDTQYYKNVIYGSFGRQGYVHVKYERSFLTNDYRSTIANVGLGLIPVEDETDVKIITPEIGQLIGFKNFFLELGVEPSINFISGTTYVDLNGIIGLRYQQYNYKSDGIMVQIGYNPRLINSTDGFINVPFYLGIGMSF